MAAEDLSRYNAVLSQRFRPSCLAGGENVMYRSRPNGIVGLTMGGAMGQILESCPCLNEKLECC